MSVAAVAREQDPPTTQHYQRILLASEGRPIPDAALERVVAMFDVSGGDLVRRDSTKDF